ncbi:HlyD family efflux transporter periplasmic adaptor subunit [Coleofasciculus sp. FACHB-SPT36]|uniref:HlyD family efflux transporter periplasmic adaptor subunit n=1 Tax=Cyanophyceae TaxID=3028117 RepID=UPI00168BF991|nr:HlyD family efflux transporter periplasmic adaptor subunit [Coleofasciculus sp. FACHB-SPT36]MBD2538736.1 HlyD family efflux transporter periplasmic adaptor subunit [Coleofasciculus sp. FACHB-SPT36]
MQKPIRSISASTASNLPLTPPVEPFGSGYTGSNQNSFDSQGILSRTPTQGESGTHPGKIQRQCDRSFAEIYGGATGSIEMSVQPTSTETASNSQVHFASATSPETRTNQWSTSLQTVLDQPPSTLPRQLILGGMAFCLAFGAWATFGQIDEVGHAQGRLMPKGAVYKIDPVEMGKVANIAVKEGQAVKAGQVLVELDTQIAAGEVERLQQMLATNQMQLIQKQALLEKTHLEVKTQTAIASSDTQAAFAAISEVNAKGSATREQIAQLQTAKTANQERLETLKPLSATTAELHKKLKADVAAAVEEVERVKPLVKEGAISKKYLLDAEQMMRDRQSAITKTQLEEDTTLKDRLFEAQQALRDGDRAIASSQGDLKQTLAQAQQLHAELAQKQAQERKTQIETQQQIQELEVEMTQLKAQIAETQNLLNAAKAKLKQRFLTAAVDGVVSSLKVRNVGEVVQPSQTVAEIAPHKAPMILVASLPNQEAGFVKTGMPVKIKFDAYPYQEYGIVSGKIQSVSPDAKPDERLGEVYRIEVALDRNYINADRQNIKFKAGQTASAEIIIRRRRIADILLDPIRQMQKGGINL